HETVDLRDDLSFDLPDRSEHGPVALDPLLVSPFVGLGDPEVNRHNHALVCSLPRAQGCSGGQWTLGVDDAVAGLGEASAQRVVEEHFMPVPIPGDASGSATSVEGEAEAENGCGERPTPRERCDERSGHTAFLKIPT